MTDSPLDLIGFDALLSDEERATRDRVRAFVDAELRPHIAEWYDAGVFPTEIIKPMGAPVRRR